MESILYMYQVRRSHESKLTILAINVGLLTSVDVTVFLMLFLVCPSNGAFLVPYILMSHYCDPNSFLSVLNSRLFLRSWSIRKSTFVQTLS
ncbi:hypothetical protein EV363DRAFT_1185269 [Boletus edulis]|uniref:Uncharacterized protein n=1 Tax=Boletus edulis BED1 TaxID=1328754 RepID=A0AAD4G7N0_BOLED|nr:hypothetical protein EV363DRAFT_1185269 [Boletus edulis]KAF8423740.1 hypothetical protein L210DRAFT_2132640 [Boletus edulis BED1]KAF8423973.1 hypothetical protein L210DRAFT_2106962 [Boletus edulis BED1]